MKIIIDAMGGDNAPVEILKGAANAVTEYSVEIIAVGNEEIIAAAVAANNISMTNITVVNATQQIEMCDDPTTAIRHKKDSSMVVGLNMLAKGEGDAMVSAGSTGALLTGATLIVKRLPKVKRPAIATVIPGARQPFVLLDSGANVECRAEMLNAFASMGSVYAQKVLKRPKATVGLVNNGSEESKGTPLYVEAHALLKANTAINFIGNVEAKEIPTGEVDVIVCDGFTGNIILKLTEGLAKALMGQLKPVFLKNLATKIAFFAVKGGLKEFKSKMDADEIGGAMFLGVSKPVIKAHGSSGAKAIKNAIRQAKECCEGNVIDSIKDALSQQSGDENDD